MSDAKTVKAADVHACTPVESSACFAMPSYLRALSGVHRVQASRSVHPYFEVGDLLDIEFGEFALEPGYTYVIADGRDLVVRHVEGSVLRGPLMAIGEHLIPVEDLVGVEVVGVLRKVHRTVYNHSVVTTKDHRSFETGNQNSAKPSATRDSISVN